ncbi:MAG: GspE/PulE family protein [Patescibacteria group bacterium]|nr:GspE/PulE family protein [Patescibacteria group bacterium]
MATEGNKRVIGDVVSSYNRDEKEEAVEARAAELGLPYYDVRKMELAPDVLSFVSVDEAQKGIVPLLRKGDSLIVGVADVKNENIEKIIDYLSEHFTVERALISWDAVKDAITHYEGLHKQELEEERDYEIQLADSAMTFKELEAELNSAALRDILKFILSAAISAKSSDIHIEPQKTGARIRFRIDGVLHVVGELKKERYDYILSQVELAAGMKLNVNEAQEGRLEVVIKGKTVNVRVETMPTLYGHDISLRLFNTESTMLELKDLGLSDYNRGIVEKMLANPQGMVLVVGPTGAGKTTTIYAILNRLNEPGLKIITLEDPIEYALPGIAQSQIEEGSSFSIRLKAVLREDPDIVMVGEIRDAETADVALHASLTGHLMVSTFHANNAAAALGLLKEITDNNSLLSAGINLVIAQRLVRRLCSDCKKEYQLTQEEYEHAQSVFNEIPEELKKDKTLTFFESAGCDKCNGLGFSGRIGIFEMLPLTVEMQKLLTREDITITELQEAAKKSGMVTMEQDGLLKAIDGVTALSEVMRAVKE